ncbi:MAG: Sir2 family NAD-dependent protein deacetylase [Actinomycetales bacterium]
MTIRTLVPQVHAHEDAPTPVNPDAGLQVLADLLVRPGVVAITGAGISTESGIPDYRGPSGRARNATPMSYQEFVSSAAARQRYWARSFAGWSVMGQATPNAGHRALARLQRGGWLHGLITQNVDQLHARAGSAPLVELHGSLGSVVCLDCGERSDRLRLQARLAAANPLLTPSDLELGDDAGEVKPDGDLEVLADAVRSFVVVECESCGGRLKPDVVFFGESVPRDRSQRCHLWVEQAPAVVVFGSSLAVMSAYRFVRQAAKAGRTVVIVNQGPTRGDLDATFRVEAPLGAFLGELAAACETRA